MIPRLDAQKKVLLCACVFLMVLMAAGAAAAEAAPNRLEIHHLLDKLPPPRCFTIHPNPRLDIHRRLLRNQTDGSSSWDFAFHGTKWRFWRLILRDNFLIPTHPTHHFFASGVNGTFGLGSYHSPHFPEALKYTERSLGPVLGTGVVILSLIRRGNVFRCPSAILGAPQQVGYDTHESPDGKEWVVFSRTDIVPIAALLVDHECLQQQTSNPASASSGSSTPGTLNSHEKVLEPLLRFKEELLVV
jgi:hypothetical protein